ncbi:hypothetical protein P20652_3708 [Pseudoalteromonas sp. BSi20652]|jgi:hypothetical protein|uniref:phage tail terminator protein n=1 Tax=unclassified Pseudoalteromonas TaxID=194690 RepID=UPI0002318C21|nr:MULTISPECIES: hypothetical protein [unclassified Pseudoalteromonas]MBH0026279.1 hypothetical protein [Pseudoalteromonas sp. SWN29]GAA61819.1 hypothetical protein P20652_3708 [Pseudoalteromonas sp. BSi20652]
MFEITTDYFAAQNPLKQALEQVPGIKRVYLSDELADVKEDRQTTPSIHLMYYGDNLPESKNAGYLMQLTQTWIVVLVVRKQDTNAGEHLTNIIRAMAGKVLNGTGPWLRVNTPAKPQFTKGHAYYPLAFTCQMRLKGAL